MVLTVMVIQWEVIRDIVFHFLNIPMLRFPNFLFSQFSIFSIFRFPISPFPIFQFPEFSFSRFPYFPDSLIFLLAQSPLSQRLSFQCFRVSARMWSTPLKVGIMTWPDHIYIYIYMCIYIYLYLYFCLHLFIFTFIYHIYICTYVVICI